MQWIIRDISLGSNIQEVRIKCGMTQEQLVAQMQIHGSNISRSTLANIEAGTRNIKVNDLRIIREILRTDYEEFFKK